MSEELSPKGHRTHGGRVVHEEDEEERMTDALTDAMVAQAGPLAFATGKFIEYMKAEPGSLQIRFSDGSGLTVLGEFTTQYHAHMDVVDLPQQLELES